MQQANAEAEEAAEAAARKMTVDAIMASTTFDDASWDTVGTGS